MAEAIIGRVPNQATPVIGPSSPLSGVKSCCLAIEYIPATPSAPPKRASSPVASSAIDLAPGYNASEVCVGRRVERVFMVTQPAGDTRFLRVEESLCYVR